MLQKMVNGGTVNSWICVNFSRSVQDNVARGFCYDLAQMCTISGMVLVFTSSLCYDCLVILIRWLWVLKPQLSIHGSFCRHFTVNLCSQ